MPIETVQLDEIKLNLPGKPELTRRKCTFYKTENCDPKTMKFKICSKCSRCSAMTVSNFAPQMFERIIGLALFLMKTMGMSLGNAERSIVKGGFNPVVKVAKILPEITSEAVNQKKLPSQPLPPL